jgi:hypothetical protein
MIMNWRFSLWNAAFLISIASGALLAGCTVTREVGYGYRQTIPESLPKHLTGEQATVTTDSGNVQGIISAVTNDTLFLRTDISVPQSSFALREISHVYVEGAGPLGPILGALGGGSIGALIGAELGGSGGGGWVGLGRGIGMIFGGGFGVLIGAIVGTNFFPSYDYVFPSPGSVPASKTVRARVAQVVETGDTITFRWGEKTVSLPRSQVTIVRESDGTVSLRMSRALFRQLQEK